MRVKVFLVKFFSINIFSLRGTLEKSLNPIFPKRQRRWYNFLLDLLPSIWMMRRRFLFFRRALLSNYLSLLPTVGGAHINGIVSFTDSFIHKTKFIEMCHEDDDGGLRYSNRKSSLNSQYAVHRVHF